jgi:hypothetical protein
MTIFNNHPKMRIQAHLNSMFGFGNYNGLSLVNPDQSMAFNKPLPPYLNNSLPVSPMSDVFLQSALLSTASDCLLSMGPIVPPPLTPVPLGHSSLYQVLKLDSPPSPVLQCGMSSIAHPLGPQELQAQQASPSCAPVLGSAQRSMIGTSESAGQTSLAAVAV